jgi:hypothetical protein
MTTATATATAMAVRPSLPNARVLLVSTVHPADRMQIG